MAVAAWMLWSVCSELDKQEQKKKLLSALPPQPIGSLYLLSTHSAGCLIGLILVRSDLSGLFTGGHGKQTLQIL